MQSLPPVAHRMHLFISTQTQTKGNQMKDNTTIKRGRGKPRKQDITHGVSMYRYRGCRCDICTSAYKTKKAEYIANANTGSVKLRLDPTPLIELINKVDTQHLVKPRTIAMWKQKGICVYWADFYCVKFGHHPYEVFGSAFYQDIAESA